LSHKDDDDDDVVSEWYGKSHKGNTSIYCSPAAYNAAVLPTCCHWPRQPQTISTFLSRGWQI